MKYFLAFILTFLLSSPFGWSQRQLIDRVVAVVNDEVITQSELDGLFRPIYAQYSEAYSGQQLAELLNDARTKLLNQLIEDRLVFQEAKEKGVEVTQVEVDDQMDKFRKQFPDEAAMEDAMRSEGFTYATMEERIRRQAMIRKLHAQEVRSHVIIAPGEIEQYYQENPEKFSSDDSIKIRSLTIKKNDEARRKGIKDEKAFQKITHLHDQVISGEDFGEIAQEHSQDTRAEDGGLSGWIGRQTMIEAIDKVIFALGKGEVSEVIETPMGYHLFRVEDKKEGDKQTLDEAREAIYSHLYGIRADARFKEWMESLKKNAYISIR